MVRITAWGSIAFAALLPLLTSVTQLSIIRAQELASVQQEKYQAELNKLTKELDGLSEADLNAMRIQEALTNDPNSDKPTNSRGGQRYSAAAAEVCKAPQFQLTLENWHDSQAGEFLRQWGYELVGNPDYARRGIIGSLAYAYLGKNEFHCTIGSSHACLVSCPEVVTLVNDPKEARALYFVMTAARHYLEVMEVADRALLAAQVNVGQWTDSLAQKFYWIQETHHDRVFRMTVSLMHSFVSFMLFTFLPMFPYSAMQSTVEAKITDLDNKLAPAQVDVDKAALDLIGKKTKVDGLTSGTKQALKWGELAFNVAPHLGFASLDLFSWEGYEKAPVLNVAELGLAISRLVSDMREKNAKAVQESFSGRVIDNNGNTILGKILESGAFLAIEARMLSQWTGPSVEKRLTDALKYRIFSEALKSQGVFIQCSKDMNAFTCENDNRGPQNLKACVDNRVCYMNKWSGRGYYWRHHVEEPFGVDQMGDWPLMVTPEDIIISSYRTYQLTRKGTSADKVANKVAKQEDLVSPANFMDASTPGSFFLPVCVNDRFHQHTTLNDYSLIDDFNPNSDKKTLPCSCGEFWGDETEAVWRDTGLDVTKHNKRYRAGFCARQLNRKIGDNKLERFVADCRLKVHKEGWIRGYQDGKHPFCEVVIDMVTKHGKGPDEMDPYLRLALECKIGLHKTALGKPKKECDLYMKTGFEELVHKKNAKAKEWGFA